MSGKQTELSDYGRAHIWEWMEFLSRYAAKQGRTVYALSLIHICIARRPWSMNSEYGQSSSKENSVEQRKPMEELKRMNQPSSAPPSAPQPIQPIVIQCDLPQAMDKLTRCV